MPTLTRRAMLPVIAVGVLSPAAAIARAPRAAHDLISAYLDGWRRKDLNAILDCMHADLVFKGPNAETLGRDGYREATSRFLTLVESVEIRARFIEGNKAMFAYDFMCRDPIGVSRVAELVKLESGSIRETEIFFDTAPFAAARARIPS